MDQHFPDLFYQRDVVTVARALIGAVLEVEGVRGRVVETEAYDLDDPASHSYRGQTTRNAAMFGATGHAYVYRSYGLHWCLNVVCGTRPGGAVLIRALEPLSGVEVMMRRRQTNDLKLLCSGPGRLCQALGVDQSFDKRPFRQPPIQLFEGPSSAIEVGRRIGLTRGRDTLWRFWRRGSAFVSRPPPRPATRRS